MTATATIAYTHPTPRHVRGKRHETEVHALANRLGDTVQSACGNLYTVHEAPHTPDGVRVQGPQPLTCRRCPGC